MPLVRGETEMDVAVDTVVEAAPSESVATTEGRMDEDGGREVWPKGRMGKENTV